MNQLPKHKRQRLVGYDYSQSGAYFVTLCTHNRQNLLWNHVGTGLRACPVTNRPCPVMNCADVDTDCVITDCDNRADSTALPLSPIGAEVERSIRFLSNQSPYITVDHYVIMPNHVHMIVVIQNPDDSKDADRHRGLSLPDIMRRLKSFTIYVVQYSRSASNSCLLTEKISQIFLTCSSFNTLT